MKLWTRHLAGTALLVAGAIHLLPLVGVLGPDRLSGLYGVALTDPNAILLLRHRAVLFGLLAGFLLIGALHRPSRMPALIAGLVSVGSFLLLSIFGSGYSPQIERVVLVDLVALALLSAGVIAGAREARTP